MLISSVYYELILLGLLWTFVTPEPWAVVFSMARFGTHQRAKTGGRSAVCQGGWALLNVCCSLNCPVTCSGIIPDTANTPEWKYMHSSSKSLILSSENHNKLPSCFWRARGSVA